MKFCKPKTRCGRLMLRVLIVSVVLIGVISAFYLEELWRGEHAWKQYQAEAKARGTKLTIAEFIRPPIRDEDNFAAIPLFQDLFDTNRVGTTDPFKFPHASTTNRWLGQPTDFTTYRGKFAEDGFYTNATADAAHDVLEALKVFDADLAQLRAAESRADCCFPLDYSRGIAMQLPQISPCMNIARFLRLRIAAELAEGKPAEAFEDFKLGLRIYRAMERDPTLISGLVRMAVLATSLDAVHEGLVLHRWTPGQIEGIEKSIAALNIAADCEFTMQSERAFANGEIENLFTEKIQIEKWMFSDFEPGVSLETVICLLAPRGWFRQNQIRINRLYDAEIARLDAKNGTFLVVPSGAPIHFDVPIDSPAGKYIYLLANLLIPAVDKSHGKFVRNAAQTEMARTACALERHRIARGAYPKKLDDLVPEFLPKVPPDPVDGKPLRYEKNPAGGYVLWSPDFEHKFAALAGTNTPPIGDADTEQWVWRLPRSSFEATAK